MGKALLPCHPSMIDHLRRMYTGGIPFPLEEGATPDLPRRHAWTGGILKAIDRLPLLATPRVNDPGPAVTASMMIARLLSLVIGGRNTAEKKAETKNVDARNAGRTRRATARHPLRLKMKGRGNVGNVNAIKTAKRRRKGGAS